jgi:hypothetical protein
VPRRSAFLTLRPGLTARGTPRAPANVEIDAQSLEFMDGETLTDRLRPGEEQGRLRLELPARRSAVWSE